MESIKWKPALNEKALKSVNYFLLKCLIINVFKYLTINTLETFTVKYEKWDKCFSNCMRLNSLCCHQKKISN